MSFARIFIWIAVVIGIATASSAAMTGPVRCSVNNQDSTCVGHLTTAWQTPPACPNQPGWTTIASAQWIGSQYSAPQCNYQAAPTCPSGYAQTSAPNWDGATWTAPGCAAPPPPGNTGSGGGYSPSDPTSHCKANAVAAGYTVPSGLAASLTKIGSYTQVAMCYVNGPYYDGGGPNGGTQYEYACFFNNTTGDQVMADRTMIWSACQGYSSN
ncbi:hypothetical protein B0G69_8082 [Paraburkholderia sp. RAU2J]|nr:hypothetical protein B0G69_8082 [Paraburkholderia sp. RAU2J]